MTPDDLQSLRALALKATPGPWEHCAGHWVYAGKLFIAMVDDSVRGGHEAAFIAAANPQAVLGLLERLRAAEDLIQHRMVCAHCAESSVESCDDGGPLLSAYRGSKA
jgi:hypothetical protein